MSQHTRIRIKQTIQESPSQSPIQPSPSKKQLGWTNYLFLISLAISVKIWQPLAIANSKQADGSYTYNKSAMILLCQILKLSVCSIILLVIWFQTPPDKRLALINLRFTTSLHFLVPSLLYAASNTLVLIGMSYINPALFHVFGNIRIIIAGVLSRIILQKKLTDYQWVSLVLLTIGAVLTNLGKSTQSSQLDSNLTGMLILTLMCLCSTSSSIYTEKYYKKTEELSIFYQNCVMYVYGILVNGVLVFVTENQVFQQGLMLGFDKGAFQVLIAQSVMGVILSFIFKFLDNLVYVFSLTVSMVLTAFISSVYFGFEFTLPFICAIMIISLAIYLYYRDVLLDSLKIQRNIRI